MKNKKVDQEAIHMSNELFVFHNVLTRWASPENRKAQKGQGGINGKGRKGSAFISIKKGEEVILAQEKEACGTIRRIWITVNDRTPKMLRGLKIEFYWDGCQKPAVSAPFGDFFGVSLGRTASFHSALFSNPEGRSFNCFIPMPFRKGMKVLLKNESNKDLTNCFYDIDYTIMDEHFEDVMYFHAVFERQNPTVFQEDFAVLPHTKGRGRFLGSNMGVKINAKEYLKSWWGEGEVKVYLDGDSTYPTLCGTGVEDYVGTGWSGLGANTYSEPYQGTIIDDREKGEVAFYRYHVIDPIYFSNDIKVTIQQIGSFDPISKPHLHYQNIKLNSTEMKLLDLTRDGMTKNFGLFERQDDWSACAYLYLDRPDNDFKPLLSAEKRMEGLEDMEIDPSMSIEY